MHCKCSGSLKICIGTPDSRNVPAGRCTYVLLDVLLGTLKVALGGAHWPVELATHGAHDSGRWLGAVARHHLGGGSAPDGQREGHVDFFLVAGDISKSLSCNSERLEQCSNQDF